MEQEGSQGALGMGKILMGSTLGPPVLAHLSSFKQPSAEPSTQQESQKSHMRLTLGAWLQTTRTMSLGPPSLGPKTFS